MSDRIRQELEIVRACYSNLEYREEGHWVRIPSYPAPEGIWNMSEVEVCFQMPEQLPGQAPYGLYVRPELLLRSGGGRPDNYTYPATTPFGDGWGKFSWQLEPWRPTSDPRTGSNMLNFIWSFAERLRQGR